MKAGILREMTLKFTEKCFSHALLIDPMEHLVRSQKGLGCLALADGEDADLPI